MESAKYFRRRQIRCYAIGSLHIEQAFLKMIGCWLEGSGFDRLIVDANIASAGTAESFYSVSHITKTRNAHQITNCTLNILLQKAFNESTDISKKEWIKKRITQSPLFQFWYITLQLQTLLNNFVLSLRSGNFMLYCDCLTEMCPWFFAFDRTHYARWLPIHMRDMFSLQYVHKSIAGEFLDGNFVIRKTNRKCYAISIDQAHEQHNAIVKCEGGAIGLTENPSALRRWMIAGPETARIITEFEKC